MTDIKTNIANIEQQMTELAKQHNNTNVCLLAVSKTKPIELIKQAYDHGQRAFGENYVQEAVEKIAQLSALPDIQWHFIGPIQSNKTKLIAENFDWVQSVDREKIAIRLNDQRPKELPPLNVCIQVNISQEQTKSGLTDIEAIKQLCQVVAKQPNLNLKGLMAIPAPSKDENDVRQSHQAMQNLFSQLKQLYPQMDTLSMGMSGDMNIAIEQGSTMIRIGTAIFGARG